MKLGLKRGHAWHSGVIRWRLASNWSHSAIMLKGVVYQATALHGVDDSIQNPEEFEWFDIGGDDAKAIDIFEHRRGNGYDWFSLLAFVFPGRYSDSKRDYCFELCLAMMGFDVPTRGRVTAETLLYHIVKFA